MAPREGLKIAIVGAGGYVGGELLRLLLGHPGVGEVHAFSKSMAGKAWQDVHPSLLHVGEGRFEEPDPGAAGRWADVVFLALPHGRSQSLMAELAAVAPRLVVDTAADFRLHDRALYEAAYGSHSSFELASRFSYGLADVASTRLAGSRLVAAPGCFATATLLALWPIATRARLDGAPVSVAATGSSGSGAIPGPATHHPRRAHSFFAYGVTGHRHEAEIQEQLRQWTGDPSALCSLVPHSAPLVRGIHVCLHARLAAPVQDPVVLLREAYAGRPFIRILDRPPEVAAVAGTNFAHLHATARRGGREVIVLAAIDNLVKGAAGQAVQCMNLALGLEETAGLLFPGIFPC